MRHFDNSHEQSDKEFDTQFLKESIEEVKYFLHTSKLTRINHFVNIVKDTSNNCLSCKRHPTYIYCPIFNLHFSDNKYFDETGEKDGCSKYIS